MGLPACRPQMTTMLLLLSLTVGHMGEAGGPGGGSGDGEWWVVSGSGAGIPACWGFTHSCALNDDDNDNDIIIFAVVDSRGVQRWSVGIWA